GVRPSTAVDPHAGRVRGVPGGLHRRWPRPDRADLPRTGVAAYLGVRSDRQPAQVPRWRAQRLRDRVLPERLADLLALPGGAGRAADPGRAVHRVAGPAGHPAWSPLARAAAVAAVRRPGAADRAGERQHRGVLVAGFRAADHPRAGAAGDGRAAELADHPPGRAEGRAGRGSAAVRTTEAAAVRAAVGSAATAATAAAAVPADRCGSAAEAGAAGAAPTEPGSGRRGRRPVAAQARAVSPRAQTG